VKVDGTCPTCGRAVDPGHAHATVVAPAADVGAADAVPADVVADVESGADPEDEEPLGPIPWHLKLLAAALAVYLGFRAWQGIEWLAHQL
jgi:hypothetical protein